MTTIRIGGVPEHFNLAWYLALKDGCFKRHGINLRWKDFYGGTGAMNLALRNHEIDMAVILTEGIIKDIVDGNPSKIIQTYVQSPLIWGIHVGYNSKYQDIDALRHTKAAISRFGSGSHLMAFINAQNNHWNLETDLQFEVVKDIDGAVKALNNGRADYFMWERFMTKPLVDNKTFRHLGNCPTPWPSFVIAATDKALQNHEPEIKTIMALINKTTSNFKAIPDIDKTIAKRYDQRQEDVKEWLHLTHWSQAAVEPLVIRQVQDVLLGVGIISEQKPYERLVVKL